MKRRIVCEGDGRKVERVAVKYEARAIVRLDNDQGRGPGLELVVDVDGAWRLYLVAEGYRNGSGDSIASGVMADDHVSVHVAAPLGLIAGGRDLNERATALTDEERADLLDTCYDPDGCTVPHGPEGCPARVRDLVEREVV